MSTATGSVRRGRLPLRVRAPVPVVLAAAGLLAVAGGASGTRQATGSSPGADPLDVSRLLDELAAEKGYYLVLDTPGRRLVLLFEGVVLREYPVESIEIGRVRMARGWASHPAWAAGPWRGGSLTPPLEHRTNVLVSDQVVPPEDRTGTVAETPLPPEELHPAPPRFRIRFEESRALELVRAGGSPGLRHSLRGALDRLALLVGRGDRVRIRVVLAPDEHGALYRSVPEASRFFAVFPATGTSGRPEAQTALSRR